MRRNIAAVVRWEYHRFAKPRDLVIGVVFFAVSFGIFGFVGHFVRTQREEPRSIGVVSGERMGLAAVDSLQRFHLVHLPESVADTGAGAEAILQAHELDALLVVHAPDRAELLLEEERGWQQEFLALVTHHRQASRLLHSGIDAETLSALTSPIDLTRKRLQGTDADATRADPKTALLVIGTMLLGLMLGFSYVFIAITGEKTQKVTETVLAAISPQEWIDGKILGLTLVVLVNVVCYGLGYLLYKAAATLLLRVPFSLPVGVGDPASFALLMLFALLGFGFWFTLFAVIAATITDPNSSGRSSFMMLPFVPLGLTLLGLDQPDALWMRLAALLPGVSPAAMPVRILRGDPGVWEIVLSLVLLAWMVLVFRRAAGRVFGTVMLLTGKEPSWGEVWRWSRQT